MSDARKRWDGIWAARDHPTTAPEPWLEEIADALPTAGTAVDLAGGAGRNAAWLAARGLDVTVVDVSDEGLALAQRLAADRGLHVRTRQADLEAGELLDGSWDVVLITHFLHRPLLAGVADLMAPGGLLVVVHPTRSNLERHPKPSARFLLEDGELPGLLPSSLTIERYEEGWTPAGAHHARLVARR